MMKCIRNGRRKFILTHFSLETPKRVLGKHLTDKTLQNAASDKMPQNAASDQGLHFLKIV